MELPKNIEEIEKLIVQKAKSSQKKWQDTAKLIIEVEKSEIWRSKPKTRSFTAWVKSLSVVNDVSISWLWKSYRSGKTMIEIWNSKNPQNTDSFDEICEEMGDLSISALDTLETLKKSKIDQKVYDSLVDEYLNKTINVSSLIDITRIVGRCKRLGLEPLELYASIYRISFRELIGLEIGKEEVVNSIPPQIGLDSIIIIPQKDDKPILIGIKVKDFETIPDDSIDYLLALIPKGKEMEKSLSYSVGVVDCVSGQLWIKDTLKSRKTNQESKGRLAITLLNRVLTNDDSIIEV